MEVDKKAIEDTKLVISVKTLAWGFGILTTIASSVAGYFHNEAVNKINSLNIKVEKSILHDKEWKEKKFDPHIKDASEMQGDIKVILDRTSRMNKPTAPMPHLSTTAPTN